MMFSTARFKLNDFLGSFTFRQKFVFSSLVFFLFMPIPLYLTLKNLHFYIHNDKVQLLNVAYQETASALLDLSWQYKIMTEKSDSLSSLVYQANLTHLETSFNTYLKQLDLLDNLTSSESNVRKIEEKWTEADFDSTHFPIKNFKFSLVSSVFIDKMQVNLQAYLDKVNFNLMISSPYNSLLYSLQSSLANLLYQKQLIGNLVFKKEKDFLISKLQLQNSFEETQQQLLPVIMIRHPSFLVQKLINQIQNREKTYLEAYELFLRQVNSTENNLDYAIFKELLRANESLRLSLIHAIKELILHQKAPLLFLFWTLILLLVIAVISILIYIFNKILSSHLTSLISYLEQPVQGHFSPCFCAPHKDEFGQVGKIFNKINGAFEKINRELQELGKSLAHITLNATQTTREQEFSVYNQEVQIRVIELAASHLGQNQNALMEKADRHRLNSDQTPSIERAKTGLDYLKTNLMLLVESSSHILFMLTTMEERVSSLKRLIAFMTKVSESANLLSLNASIETESIKKNKEIFSHISYKIQLFAVNTEKSTRDIKKIVNEISNYMTSVRQEAEECLKEINSGAQQLIEVSYQLSGIAKQGAKQLDKFENVSQVIHNGTLLTEKMIESIVNLRKEAQQSTQMIHQLHHSLADLGITTNKLKEVVSPSRYPVSHKEPFFSFSEEKQ